MKKILFQSFLLLLTVSMYSQSSGSISAVKNGTKSYYIQSTWGKNYVIDFKAGSEKVFVDSLKIIRPKPTPGDSSIFKMLWVADFENMSEGSVNYSNRPGSGTNMLDTHFTNGVQPGSGLSEVTTYWWHDFDIRSQIAYSSDKINPSKVLRINFPKKTFWGGAENGYEQAFDVTIETKSAEQITDELYVSYNFRFKPGFLFSKNFKLGCSVSGGYTPEYKADGTGGFQPNIPCPNGGQPSVVGFNANVVSQPLGGVQTYNYDHSQTCSDPKGCWAQTGKIDDPNFVNEYAYYEIGKWNTMTIRIVLSDVDASNGVMEYFINGKHLMTKTGIKHRRTSNIKITGAEFVWFFGQDFPQEWTYGAYRDEWLEVDDMMFWKYNTGISGIIYGKNANSKGSIIKTPMSEFIKYQHYGKTNLISFPPANCINETFTATSGKVLDGSGNRNIPHHSNFTKTINTTGSTLQLKINYAHVASYDSLIQEGTYSTTQSQLNTDRERSKILIYKGLEKSAPNLVKTIYTYLENFTLNIPSGQCMIEWYDSQTDRTGNGFDIDYQSFDASGKPLSMASKSESTLEYELLKSNENELFTNKTASLFQNTPNPFSNDTEIAFYLPETIAKASLYIYDIQGSQIKAISITQRGNGKVIISGSELNAGMYFYKLVADNKKVDTKRMVLTK